jgi:putative RNA 2'-phosphotransferase
MSTPTTTKTGKKPKPPDVRTSKFLSLILRHRPEAAGIGLDAEGWAEVAALLAGMARRGHAIDFEDLVRIVETNDKRRYAFNPDRSRIRAVQGHSRTVDLGYPPMEPPEYLFHGTVARFIEPIRAEGLRPGSRQHVHLSPDRETADKVGRRRGQPVILTIGSRAMAAQSHRFWRADNGVWLTLHVPAEFIVAWE